MEIFHKIKDWQNYRKRHGDVTVGFVPTMGALHEGHLSLVRRSKQENDITVVSIYVNPTQFNDQNDLKTYPNSWDEDVALLQETGITALFAPDYSEMYPDNYSYKIQETELSKILCGASRPGHFDGVLTVVLKLFSIIGECRAYFGEKDYQQFLLIKGMAEAFFLPVQVIPCPLIRENDGLAMSSRNRKLSREGREKAPEFFKILSGGKDVHIIKHDLEQAGFKVDYIEKHFNRIFGAVLLEEVRLIDNVEA